MTTFAELQETEEWQNLALPAQEHYTYELPYHNWGHAMSVAEAVVALGNRCIARGMHLNIGLLAVAAAWHDADYMADHMKLHHPTKESLSAYAAETFLRSQGAAEDYALQVGRAILGTTHGVSRRGLHALVLHRADIATIGGPYETFASNSCKLLQERRLAEPKLSFAKFVEGNRLFIGLLIAESVEKELPQLGEPVDSPGSFPVEALANITRMTEETETSLAKYGAAA